MSHIAMTLGNAISCAYYPDMNIELKNKLYDSYESLGLFLARLTLASVFITAGWGKLQNLEKPIEFFTSLGIPLASIMAPTVSTFEFFCGVLLLLGLKTRLAALPIIAIMTVAIITAKTEEITTWTDIAGLSEFLYIVLAVLLISFGPGKIAVDHIQKPPRLKILHS